MKVQLGLDSFLYKTLNILKMGVTIRYELKMFFIIICYFIIIYYYLLLNLFDFHFNSKLENFKTVS